MKLTRSAIWVCGAATLCLFDMAMTAPAAIVVGNSGGQVWIRNDNLTDVVTDSGFGTISDIEILTTGIAISDSSGAGRVYVRNPDTLGEAVPAVDGFGAIRALAVLPNGRLVVGNSGGDVWVRNADLTDVISGSGFGDITDAEILSTGIAVSNTVDQRVYVRNPNTLGEAVPASSGYGSIVNLAVLNDGNLVVANSAGQVWVRDASDLSDISDNFGFGTITEVAVLAGGNVLIANSAGQIYIRTPSLSEAVGVEGGYGTVSALLALPDGNFVVANQAGILRVVSPTAGQPVLHFNEGFGNVTALAFVPEPSSMMLLALGALAFVRRKRV